MDKLATNLFPMMVTPLNFSKGDVVKKMVADGVTSPYTGIVTAIVPSTNKVEVQWPDSMGIEEPWDLIKVNPVINPPVVKEDKFYNTYQNSKKVQDHINKLQHYNVLEDYLTDHLKPLIFHAAELYNLNYSKKEAFKVMTASCDNKRMAEDALNCVFNDVLNIHRAVDLCIDGDIKEANLDLSGNSDIGFKVICTIGGNKNEYYYDTYKTTLEGFNKIESILESLDSSPDENQVISSLIKK